MVMVSADRYYYEYDYREAVNYLRSDCVIKQWTKLEKRTRLL